MAGYLSPPTPSRSVVRSVCLSEKLMAMCEYLLPLGTPKHLSSQNPSPSFFRVFAPPRFTHTENELHLQQYSIAVCCISPIISRDRNRRRHRRCRRRKGTKRLGRDPGLTTLLVRNRETDRTIADFRSTRRFVSDYYNADNSAANDAACLRQTRQHTASSVSSNASRIYCTDCTARAALN